MTLARAYSHVVKSYDFDEDFGGLTVAGGAPTLEAAKFNDGVRLSGTLASPATIVWTSLRFWFFGESGGVLADLLRHGVAGPSANSMSLTWFDTGGGDGALSGSLTGGFSGGGIFLSGVAPDEWHLVHLWIELTAPSLFMHVRVDDDDSLSTLSSVAQSTPAVLNGPVTLGQFDGMVDDLAFLDRALDAGEMTEDWAEGTGIEVSKWVPRMHKFSAVAAIGR